MLQEKFEFCFFRMLSYFWVSKETTINLNWKQKRISSVKYFEIWNFSPCWSKLYFFCCRWVLIKCAVICYFCEIFCSIFLLKTSHLFIIVSAEMISHVPFFPVKKSLTVFGNKRQVRYLSVSLPRLNLVWLLSDVFIFVIDRFHQNLWFVLL